MYRKMVIVARGIVRTMNGHGDLCAFDDTTGAQITQKGWLKKRHIILLGKRRRRPADRLAAVR